MACVTGQQRMLTPPRHLILPLHLSGTRVALHSILYLLFGLWLCFTQCILRYFLSSITDHFLETLLTVCFYSVLFSPKYWVYITWSKLELGILIIPGCCKKIVCSGGKIKRKVLANHEYPGASICCQVYKPLGYQCWRWYPYKINTKLKIYLLRTLYIEEVG
jgi:hypothetical protein